MKRFFLLLTLFISSACAATEKLDLAAANELAHTVQACADKLGIEAPAEIQVFLEKQAPIPTREEFIQAIRLILEVAVSRELGLEGTGITRTATCAKPVVCANPCPPCDLSEVIGLLLQIRSRIGSVSDPVCANTILGVLGDACNILGVSISEAISEELACCALTNSLLQQLILGQTISVTLVFDVTSILTSIQEVQNTLTACCAATQNNFNGTFTELNLIYTTEVAGFNGTFTAIAACCNNTQTNFNGTFTELTLIYTTLVAGFNGTFTELNQIDIDINNGFNGTFTALNACCNSTQTELNLIYTTLVAGFNGTFTELNLIYTTMVTDFNGVFTSIRASTCDCNSIFTELNLIYTTEVAGFNGTFTELNLIYTTEVAGFNGTFTELNLIFTTMVTDFNGVFTSLAANTCDCNSIFTELNLIYTTEVAGFNGTFTELNLIYTTEVAGFNGTFTELNLIFTTMVTDFNGVFTALNACCNSTQTELNLIYTTIVNGFNGTFTELTLIYTTEVAGFNGTFTELNLIFTTMVADFNGTWTMIEACCNSTQTELNLIYTTIVAGFNGTFTELNLIYTTEVAGFNGTFTELNLIFTTVVTDFNGVFTALNACCNSTQTELNLIYTTIVNGFNGTFTELTLIYTTEVAGFNGTFTELNLIYTTLVADFNGTFTALSACCNATQTELNLIYTTLVADFNGTFTELNLIFTTMVADFNGTWTQIAAGFNGTFTELNLIYTTEVAGFNGTFTELNLIYTTMVTDFNGVFTVLAAQTATMSAIYANICSPSLITQANLPVTLSTPGRYILVENANYAPGAATPAVTIASSNVTFDMLCFTIQQTNATAGVNGITVNNTLSNIKIRNGQLKNFTQTGIAVGTGESGVSIDNVTVNGAQIRGISCVGSVAAPTIESSITNCTAINCCTAAAADNVLTLSECSDMEISSCLFNKNGSGSLAGTLAIVKVTDSLKCQFSKVETNDNTGVSDLRCFSLNNAVDCTLDGCSAKNNIASSATSNARGFFLEGAAVGLTATGNIFNNCIVLNLTGGSVTDGFLSDTNCNDNLFTNCLVSNISAQNAAGACHGYRAINNNRNRFRTCLALTCTSLSTVAAPFYGTYGFKIDSTTSTGITDCTASDNTAAVTGRGVGFFWFQTNAATCFNCVANRNTIGFDATNLTFNNQSFVQNLAQKNTGAVTQYAGFPAGAKADSISAATIDSSKVNAWTNVGVA